MVSTAAGGGTDLFAEVEALVQEYRDEVLAPRLAAAGESCAAGRLAMQTVLALERQAGLLGGADPDGGIGDIPGLDDLMEVVGRVCLQEEYELCRDEHIVHRMIPVWLGIERQAQLLGSATEDSPSSLAAEALELVDRCLRFALEYESTVRYGDSEIGWEIGMTATVPIRLTGVLWDGPVLSGRGVMENVHLAAWSLCPVVVSRGGGEFEVVELGYEVAYRDSGDEVGHVTDITLRYASPLGSESWTVDCGGDLGPLVHPSQYWVTLLAARQSVGFSGYDTNDASFTESGWRMIGEEMFAVLERFYSSPRLQGGTTSDTVSFRLYHRPG
jgi:hypothetical protein